MRDAAHGPIDMVLDIHPRPRTTPRRDRPRPPTPQPAVATGPEVPLAVHWRPTGGRARPHARGDEGASRPRETQSPKSPRAPPPIGPVGRQRPVPCLPREAGTPPVLPDRPASPALRVYGERPFEWPAGLRAGPSRSAATASRASVPMRSVYGGPSPTRAPTERSCPGTFLIEGGLGVPSSTFRGRFTLCPRRAEIVGGWPP